MKISNLGKALNTAEQKQINGGGKRDEGLFEDCNTQHEGGACYSDSDCPDAASCSQDGPGIGVCSCDTGFGGFGG